MGLDQYGQIRNNKIDFKKVYSDEYDPIKDGFVWRKHARLQTFMAREFKKQNPKGVPSCSFKCPAGQVVQGSCQSVSVKAGNQNCWRR